jgi:hypothetical protein
MAIGKNVTQIAPRYEFASADRKLSLPACEEADLQHVGEPIQSKPFLYLMPLRVAILHQDCMNIDMQLVNRSVWRRPSEHDEKVGEVATLESDSSPKRRRMPAISPGRKLIHLRNETRGVGTTTGSKAKSRLTRHCTPPTEA